MDNKIVAFWGTGIWARLYVHMHVDKVDCFIDNDRSKIGMLFEGKKVYHPSEIKDWKNYYVIVPNSYFAAIDTQLQSYGLDYETDYIKWVVNTRAMGVDIDYLIRDYNDTMKNIKRQIEEFAYDRPVILFWGQHTAFDKLYDHKFLDNLIDNDKYKVFLISAKLKASLGGVDDKEFDKRYSILKMPLVTLHTIFPLNQDVDDEIIQYVRNNRRLYELALQLQEEQQINNISGYCFKAFYIEKYLTEMFDILKPAVVMSQGSVLPLYQMIRDFALGRGVQTVFAHPGVIPGTFSLDADGEVGESLLALKREAFLKLDLNHNDMDMARKVIDFCNERNFNRREQPDVLLSDELKKNVIEGKKTIFFAGQNDVCSYMFPYNDRAKYYYSPIYSSSIDAAVALANICEKNGWNFIYKPHPDYVRLNEKNRLPKSALFLEQANLNELMEMADLTVTILSTTSVNALIKGKPVMMLGYNWLTGSGCTYECFEEKKVEKTIKEALARGYTKEQENNFQSFVARVLKYYVYDDNKDRELRFGRVIPKSMTEILSLKKLLNGGMTI